MTPRPYFESVRDVYVRSARELYRLGAAADAETADPGQYLGRGDQMRSLAQATWTLTTRQENDLYRLRCRCEDNTPEGRAKAERVREALR